MKGGQSASFHAVLLAGGSGKRLWPLSTSAIPKQFLKIGSDQSLLRRTAQRLFADFQQGNIWVVCGNDQVSQVKEHVPEIPPDRILVEPAGRNTLAAIALAAAAILSCDSQATMAILPSDHWLPEMSERAFCRDLASARQIAEFEQGLVVFGVPARSPETGFGYLQIGEPRYRQETNSSEMNLIYFPVKKFHEKPAQDVAELYLKNGFFWNVGVFVWSAAIFRQELERCQPVYTEAWPNLLKNFSKLPGISVDHGLLEKSSRVFMMPASFAWDDVGSFAALKNLLPSDANGNHIQGKVFIRRSHGNIVIANSRPVALVGVQGLAVIETPEAVLVLNQDCAQEVRELSEIMQQEKGEKA